VISELNYKKAAFLKEHGKSRAVWFGFFKSKSTLKAKSNTPLALFSTLKKIMVISMLFPYFCTGKVCYKH
jgi:hypothetical protein